MVDEGREEQTDRQKDWQGNGKRARKDGHTGRATDGDRWIDRQRERETDDRIESRTTEHANGQTDIHTDVQTESHTIGPLTNRLSFRLHFRNDSLIIWWLSDKTRTEMYLRGTTRAKRSRENRINFCLNSFRPTLSGPTQEQMEQKIYRGSIHIFQPNCKV